MELIKTLIISLDLFIKSKFLSITLVDIFIFLILFMSAFIIRTPLAKFIICRIKKPFIKNKNYEERLFDNLIAPLKLLPFFFVLIYINLNIQINEKINIYLNNVISTFASIIIFWFFYQSVFLLSQFFTRLNKLLSEAFVIWISKSLKFFIIFLGIAAILEIWGVKIGPIIAGLGLLGVAVALGAQDLFKNLISGILIILERRFELGDIIEIPNQTTGTVEQIGFRSTNIRLFNTTLVSIPNNVFSDSPIINYSKRKFRRIKWNIGLTYDTSVEKLKNICNEIENFISQSDQFIVNEEYKLFVRIEKFSESSIDILIYAFVNTNDWDEYLISKQNLAIEIKKIVELNDSSFAFPSSSIYIEKK